MPLSKAKNRARMRKVRLHKRLDSLTESNPVQPKSIFHKDAIGIIQCNLHAKMSKETKALFEKGIDADGNVIPEY